MKNYGGTSEENTKKKRINEISEKKLKTKSQKFRKGRNMAENTIALKTKIMAFKN